MESTSNSIVAVEKVYDADEYEVAFASENEEVSVKNKKKAKAKKNKENSGGQKISPRDNLLPSQSANQPEKCFELRATLNPDFPVSTPSIQTNRYFDLEGRAHPENLINTGVVSRVQEDRTHDTIEEVKVSNAREIRIEAFQSAAEKTLKIDPSELAHNFNSLIDPSREEVFASLSLSEVENYPATTSDSKLEGSIEMAIITSKLSVVRADGTTVPAVKPYLIFSVNKGTIFAKFEESYWLNSTICFGCCTNLYGGLNVDYKLAGSITGQFFVLDVENIIDVMAYRENISSYVAGGKNVSSSTCCALTCCDCQCPSCTCDIKCPYFVTFKTDAFRATDTHAIGAEPPKSFQNEFTNENVSWNIESNSRNEIFLSMHYKSRSNKTTRRCKMKLAFNHSYDDAKKFILKTQTLLASNLDPKVLDFRSYNVPPVEFQSVNGDNGCLSCLQEESAAIQLSIFNVWYASTANNTCFCCNKPCLCCCYKPCFCRFDKPYLTYCIIPPLCYCDAFRGF